MVDAVAHAVVLGCRVLASGSPSLALERRIDAAVTWFTERPDTRVLIASGGRRWEGHAEATVIADALVARGVPRGAILRELMSFTTAENAIYTAAILRARSAPSVVVVTCDWHLPRAMENFRAAGLSVEGRAAVSPPSSPVDRAQRRIHEILSSVLDRRLRARGAREAVYLAQEDPS